MSCPEWLCYQLFLSFYTLEALHASWVKALRCLEGHADVPDSKAGWVLEASSFVTNIDLAELGILHQIKTLMAPEAADVRAELASLNM